MMQIRKLLIPAILFLMPLSSGAQAIDNSLSFKNINADEYIRINYENDFFSATDKYYTQGLHGELVAPWLEKFPLSRILIHPAFGSVKYGIGIEHDGYTPSSIGSDAILYYDRPFAACLFLKSFLTAIDEKHKQRFSSAISLGVIGQAAQGMQMQTGIHRTLHDMLPHGWQYQVQNDAILNYQVDYEKQLLSYGHIFSMDADAMARAGTLSDKAGIGGTMMIGYFDDPFGKTLAKRDNFRIYAYEHPEVDVVGYDATLEGGMFDHHSPYTISAGDLTRFTFQNRFGFVVVYRRFYVEYFQSLLSNEFKSGNYHVWGGIQVAFGL